MGFFAPFNQPGSLHGGGQDNPWTAFQNSPQGQAFSQTSAPIRERAQQGFQPIIQALMQNNAGAPAAMNPMVMPQAPQQPDAMGQPQQQKLPSIQQPDPYGQKMPGQFPFGASPWKGRSR